MNGEIWFQLPPQDRLDWSITVFAAFIITFGGLYLLLDIARYRANKVTTLKRRLGFEQVSNGVFVTISLIWLTLLVTFVFATVVSVTSAVFELATLDAGAETALRGRMLSLTAMIAGLAAVAAFPITLIRMHHAARQTMVAEEQLFNEKINDASKDLAAWREVTRVVGEDEDERVLTTREPDLVTRATAIDRLYGLIKERPESERSDTANRIAAMLSLYVREHTVQVGDKIPDVPPVPVPENATSDELMEWARGLKVARSDLQKAVQAIGRIRDIPGVKLEDNAIDLRGANLQAMDLTGLNFGKGQWQRAHFQGAVMQGVNFEGAYIVASDFTGADLIWADFSGAKLGFAKLTLSRLSLANLAYCDLEGTLLDGAEIHGSNFEGADLNLAQIWGARLQGCHIDESTLLMGADFRGSCLVNIDLTEVDDFEDFLNNAFGDGSNEIEPWPNHWPKAELSEDDFNRAWRTWVAENHPNVLHYLPDHVLDA